MSFNAESVETHYWAKRRSLACVAHFHYIRVKLQTLMRFLHQDSLLDKAEEAGLCSTFQQSAEQAG